MAATDSTRSPHPYIGKVTHGLSKSREYGIWKAIRHRCENPKAAGYHRYGGRGICVCKRWHNFTLFFADMGPRPSPKHSLDRYPDQNGNYEPGNCRWATRFEQQRNMRNNRLLTFNGETLCLSAWAERVGIHRTTLQYRMLLGWSAERVLTAPLRR